MIQVKSGYLKENGAVLICESIKMKNETLGELIAVATFSLEVRD